MAPKDQASAAPRKVKLKPGFNGQRPIVVKVNRRKKKRKYTKGTKDFQVALRQAVKITNKVADAASAGVGRFEKKSRKSSRKHKDGIVRDIVPNAVSGIGKGLVRSTKVPALTAKWVRKRSFGQRLLDGMRRLLRRLRGR